MEKLVVLDTVLNECAWRHLEGDDRSLVGIHALLRTYYNRRASPDSLLFHTIINRLALSIDHRDQKVPRSQQEKSLKGPV